MVAPVGTTGQAGGTALVRFGHQWQDEAPRVEETPAAGPVFVQRRADFIAHLVAIREDCAQTRERRRAEPAEALSAYGAMPARLRAVSALEIASA